MTINKRHSGSGLGSQIPPLESHVIIFFNQAGLEICEARKFYKHYEAAGWKGIKDQPLSNWKTKAGEWIWQIKTLKPYLRFT